MHRLRAEPCPMDEPGGECIAAIARSRSILLGDSSSGIANIASESIESINRPAHVIAIDSASRSGRGTQNRLHPLERSVISGTPERASLWLH